jgi:hypothetical protein
MMGYVSFGHKARNAMFDETAAGGLRMSETSTLYDEDFFAWTRQQAKALRAAARSRTTQPLDWKNLAEEIESLGKSDRRELRSQIRRIIHHLAKLEHSSTSYPRSDWQVSVIDARSEIGGVLDDSPSLRRQISRLISGETGKALELAILDLQKYGELDASELRAFRQARYTVDQVLGDWFPLEADQLPPAVG